MENKDDACYSEISGNVAEFTVKKNILFLTILCMVEPDALFPLYAELNEVLVVQDKLTASNAATPVQGLGLGTLDFASFYVKYVWGVIRVGR